MAVFDDLTNQGFRLNSWRVQPSRLVVANAQLSETKVSPRAMSVLLELAKASGQVVNKHELMDAVWGDAEITEGMLSQTILELRTAFKDDAKNPQIIETIRRVGFRLIPPVAAFDDPADETTQELIARDPRAGTASVSRLIWPVAGVLLLALITWAYFSDTSDSNPVGTPRIMVMPFDDLSPGGGHEYFATGMADEIALQLAASSRLRLVSSRAVASLANQGLAPEKIADRFAVDLILTGSVQRREHALKLVVQLTDTNQGEELWITSLNRPIGDVFAMQDEIASAIASIVLRGGALPHRAVSTQNLTAYDVYLQGRAYQNQLTRASTEEAIRLFEHAMAIDPNYTRARARLAESLAVLGFIFQDGAATMQRALLQAELAIGVEPAIPEVWYAKALALIGLGRTAEARVQIREAVKLAPNDADALFLSGSLADARGDIAEAVKDLSLTLQVNPTSPRTVALGRLYLLLGDEATAVNIAERGNVLAPGYPTLYLAHLMTLMGKFDEAKALCDEVLAMKLPRTRNLCGFAAVVAGRTSDAKTLLVQDWREDRRAQWGPFSFAASGTHLALVADNETNAAQYLDESEEVTRDAIAEGNDHWTLRYNMAAIASQRRDSAVALEWLTKAYAEGFRDIRLLEVDPALAFVRGSKDFELLKDKVERDLEEAARAL